MSKVLNWNGRDFPEELRELPAGRYVLEPIDADAVVLNEEDEAGLRRAMHSLRAGAGHDADSVRATINNALNR